MSYTEPPPELDTPSARHLRRMREQYGVDSPEARAAFDARMAEVVAEEMAEPEVGLWWLSFADPDLPAGSQFLGVVVIPAAGYMLALSLASMLGLNPGGEVHGAGPIPLWAIDRKWHGRLLSRAEVAQLDAEGPQGPT